MISAATPISSDTRFLDELPTPLDDVMVSAGRPHYTRLTDLDFAKARRKVDAMFWDRIHIARRTAGKMRPRGMLLFIGGSGGPPPGRGHTHRGVHRHPGARQGGSRSNSHPFASML